MTEAQARSLRRTLHERHLALDTGAEVIRAEVIADAVDATRPLPFDLQGVMEVVSVTAAGFVQLRYPGKSFGPTLHYSAVRVLRRTPRSGDAR